MLGVSLQETRVYQEAREEGEIAILALLLTQKFGALPDHLTDRIHTLTREKLEALAIALVNLAAISDLETWLTANA
jgi:predicted transposase YdaD